MLVCIPPTPCKSPLLYIPQLRGWPYHPGSSGSHSKPFLFTPAHISYLFNCLPYLYPMIWLDQSICDVNPPTSLPCFNCFLRNFGINFEFQDPSHSAIASIAAPTTSYHTRPSIHPNQWLLHKVFMTCCALHLERTSPFNSHAFLKVQTKYHHL